MISGNKLQGLIEKNLQEIELLTLNNHFFCKEFFILSIVKHWIIIKHLHKKGVSYGIFKSKK